MSVELLSVSKPPHLYETSTFGGHLDPGYCLGTNTTIADRVRNFFAPGSSNDLAIENFPGLEPISFPQTKYPNYEFKKPTGLALFLRSDVEKAEQGMVYQESGLSLVKILEWLNWTLGATCGVGIAWTDGTYEPHIRLYSLPRSQMRGAIGWTWGPPLYRNRRMEISQTLSGSRWPSHYLLRTIQHEFGHFLGHYGSSSHSGNSQDIMYPSVVNIRATEPRWGKSTRDISWEQKFGPAWIVSK